MESVGDGTDYNTDRIINILQNGDKFQKKQVLKELNSFVEGAPADKLKIVFGKLLTSISLAFQDNAEMCREGAVEVCIQAIQKLDVDFSYLSSLVPAIHFRLCSDTMESSEEVRLLYMELIYLVIQKYGASVAPYVDDLSDILAKSILDSAPQVKRKASTCAIKLSEVISYELQPHTHKLIVPLSEAIKHQHWRVRVAIIEAIEIVILKGDPKVLPDALPPLASRFFDNSPYVRMAVTKLIGNWMLNHIDRYSFNSQLIPLMLSSLTDNEENIRTEGRRLWEKVGAQYVLENETDFKDKLDWEKQIKEHYPSEVTRPGLGCRILIEREVGKFSYAIGRELCDWVVGVRIKSAQLLSQVILHAEEGITQDLHRIIAPMSKAAMDKESPDVVHYVKLAAEYLGYFVPPLTYCDLIVEHLREANYGELRIVAAIVRGTLASSLKDHLPKLTNLLAHSTFKGEEQSAQLDLVHSLFTTCGIDSFDIGELIWSCLVSVAGLAASEKILNNAIELLSEMCNIGGGDRRMVFNKFCKQLLSTLGKSNWVVHCHEQFIFNAAITFTGEVVEENIDAVLEIFNKFLVREETDPEVNLKLIVTLNKIITDEDITLPTDEIREYFKNAILKEVLYEQLKWKVGRSAESVRTLASTSLFLLLPRPLPQKLLPVLISLVEDASIKTRQLTLASLTKCASMSEIHESETFSNIVTNVLKRLDDSNRKVRDMSVECLVSIYKHEAQPPYREHLNNSLLEFVFITLLIHLDDQEKEFRIIVSDALKCLGEMNYELLLRKIRVEKFRDKDIAKELMRFVQVALYSTENEQQVDLKEGGNEKSNQKEEDVVSDVTNNVK